MFWDMTTKFLSQYLPSSAEQKKNMEKTLLIWTQINSHKKKWCNCCVCIHLNKQ